VLLIGLAAGVLSSTAQAASYPNDPEYPRQWHLRRIGAPSAWKVARGKGVTIAIIDTGVNRHRDLVANRSSLEYNAFEPGKRATDLCPAGPVDKRRTCHGTFVAGVAAAATNNKVGVAGVAPDAKIMSIQVFTPRDGYDEGALADGIMWAADHGAKVINLSLGTSLRGVPVPIPFSLPDAAVLYAAARGALVVAASGNSAQLGCSSPSFNPAAVCVGASDSYDSVAKFSNYGIRLDVVAPGTRIMSTCAFTPEPSFPIYCAQDGTSAASPIVAGIGAILMGMGANNIQAAMIIRETAKDLGLPGYDHTYGFGRVDASAAVNLCKQVCAGAGS
jgi:subtilisin family serine protease